MVKKIVFSARQDHEVISLFAQKLREIKDIELTLHDPTKEFFNLFNIPEFIKNADLIIVKVRNECSIDLLHFAKLYNIPTVHDVDTVLMCKNKISLDFALRKALNDHSASLQKFLMPNSWNQSLRDIDKFKEWASPKLPIVIKSHYQHDKYNRFNFLVQKIEDIDIFCEKYKIFLYYDVYVQKFIECDGYERKIYVIGNEVFGIKRENPIYIYLREKPEKIDVDLIKREKFNINEDIITLAKILSQELKVKIFGFDLIQPINHEKYYLIDLNDFSGFRGLKDIGNVFQNFIKEYISSL
ncbi:hypothetical protein LCGC14_0731270 [marine sediment metagenome]|uniref:Inositol 1,3,4-trisphosphate 5/6-kinase ATP-grasp domain-containing protein n=1 Tax=marine sediment metagenome TaxID=412755 RepID=A0A0F9QUE6_9ZZZZ